MEKAAKNPTFYPLHFRQAQALNFNEFYNLENELDDPLEYLDARVKTPDCENKNKTNFKY